MLTSINISKLFGLYSYHIDLKSDVSNVCFITGPNGYGKTSILNIINSIYKGDFEALSKIPFERVILTFSDNVTFTVDQIHEFVTEGESDEVTEKSIILKTQFKIGSEDIYYFDWTDDCESVSLPDINIKLFFESHPLYYISDGRLLTPDGIPALDRCVEKMKEFLNNSSVAESPDFKAKKDVFMHVIEASNFANKTLQIDPRYGFRYILNNEDKTILSTDKLSSGEKHLTVMAFELIFMAPDDSLVLIDEPEISFHMLWQVDFLKNIYRILSVRKLQCIVATHSPQIFNMKWDLTVDLYTQAGLS